MITKALSIRAPWWWFILNRGKDIENRDWPTRVRGTVYVHASKWWRPLDLGQDLCTAQAIARKGYSADEMRFMQESRGHIVGTVDIVGCVTASESPWFFGEYGFVLANPVAFAKPVRCKGAQGFFTVPADVLAQLAEAA